MSIQIAAARRIRGVEKRPQPSEARRPGESTTDWCRRLDLYVNARSGVMTCKRCGAAVVLDSENGEEPA